jgi:hypothetical protein
LLKKNKKFIFLVVSIPVINIILDMVMNFYPSIKGPTGLLKFIYMSLIIILFIKNFGLKKTDLNNTIVYFSIYIATVSFFSSTPVNSFIDGPLKISLSFFMIPIGIQLGLIKQNALIKPIILLILLLLFNYLLSQIFKLGVSIYDEDSFYTGGATAAAPVIIATGLLVIFNAFNKKTLPYNNIIIATIVAASIFVILLSVKRGAILSLFVALIIYLMFSGKKLTTLIRIVFIGMILLVILNYNSDVLEKRIEARSTERNELQNEGRYRETFFVIDELKNYSLLNILFGKEAFNSGVVMKKYFGRERRLHVDYNILLNGTGIFGLLAYLYLIFLIAKKTVYLNKKQKRLETTTKNKIDSKENYSLILSLIVLSLVMSFSGGLQFVSYRIILFLVIGYALGEMIFIQRQSTFKPSQL